MVDAQLVDTEALQLELNGFVAALDRAVGAARRMHETELGAFVSGLGPAVDIARRAQEELDRRIATQFSVFDYFHERETDLSRVFGSLLDPYGNHGQGDRFLSLFLHEARKGLNSCEQRHFPVSGLEGCVVHLEYPTDKGRRIDIVIELSQNRWIGIENKPWSGESDRQIEDYLEDLLGRAGSTGSGAAWLIYLSGDGSDPGTLPDDTELKSLCLTMSYRDSGGNSASAEKWIGECLMECEAEQVRWFLKDLHAYIKRSFEPTGGRSVRSGED